MFIHRTESIVVPVGSGQIAETGLLRLVSPYQKGPDLLQPRPMLRIFPGKLLGEPHLEDTRIPTAAIFALQRRGYGITQIRKFYPDASRKALEEAIDLERSLAERAA